MTENNIGDTVSINMISGFLTDPYIYNGYRYLLCNIKNNFVLRDILSAEKFFELRASGDVISVRLVLTEKTINKLNCPDNVRYL